MLFVGVFSFVAWTDVTFILLIDDRTSTSMQTSIGCFNWINFAAVKQPNKFQSESLKGKEKFFSTKSAPETLTKRFDWFA